MNLNLSMVKQCALLIILITPGLSHLPSSTIADLNLDVISLHGGKIGGFLTLAFASNVISKLLHLAHLL